MPSLPVHPGKGLGFLTLGSSLHEILTRLKAQPLIYPSIDILYTPSKPLTAPLILRLPANGLRLRFDGPEQSLRLIEVVDFAHTGLSYKNVDFVKLPESHALGSTGPTFRHVYNMMGPTYQGEYIPPDVSSNAGMGLYVLSYPGVAISFPLQSSAWKSQPDFVTLLSSSAASPATSLAIFEGRSWQDARQGLYYPTNLAANLTSPNRLKEHRANEIEHVIIHGNGNLEMVRRMSPTFHLHLGETTAQDLVAELGPPDAIYNKSDRRVSIHRQRRESGSQQRSDTSLAIEDDLTDGENSSSHNTEDDSDEDDANDQTETSGKHSAECFYNYFHHGFDIFISYPTSPSPPFPFSTSDEGQSLRVRHADQLVATKVLLHGNVPGSFPFNRYRRVRWIINTEGFQESNAILNSETPFKALSRTLKQIWKGHLNSESEQTLEKVKQEKWVVNRGWGDSPGDSCELLGGWEEHTDTGKKAFGSSGEGPGSGTTELVGFPGLVFEFLKNDAVSCLTIY